MALWRRPVIWYADIHGLNFGDFLKWCLSEVGLREAIASQIISMQARTAACAFNCNGYYESLDEFRRRKSNGERTYDNVLPYSLRIVERGDDSSNGH